MDVNAFVNHARMIHDLTVAIERIVEDGQKVTPKRIAKRAGITREDIETYWAEIVVITEEVEAKYDF